jgi:hypothetical protein
MQARQAILTVVGTWTWCLPALLFSLSACIPGGGDGGAASNPANLQNLEIVAATQSSKTFAPTPAFNAEVSEYAVTVGSDVSSVLIVPTVADSRATVKVNNQPAVSGQPYGPINLALGTNPPITILVDAPGASKIYTITITRAANTTLSNLLLSAGPLQPAFQPQTTQYSVQAPFTTDFTTVTPTTADDHASVTVNGVAVNSGQPSQQIPLQVGQNTITIVVSAPSVTPMTYTVTVTRQIGSGNGTLSGLAVDQGALTPAFNPSTLTYTVEVPSNVAAITVTATKADSNADLTGAVSAPAGQAMGQATILLSGPGSGTSISLVVTPQSGSPVNYLITVNRAAASLLSLAVTPGALTPAFKPVITSYTVEVPFATSSIVVTASPIPGPGVTVAINGSPSPATVPLPGNATIISIVVSSSFGTKTYTVAVNKLAPSTNANLSNINVTGGTLAPTFNAGVLTYSAPIGNNSTTTLSVTTSEPSASATITFGLASSSGIGTASLLISPMLGPNMVTILGRAQDMVTTKTYTVTVGRGNQNADLSGLIVSAGALVPPFSATQISYTVATTLATTTITASVADPGLPLIIPGATLTINGSPATSGSIFPIPPAPPINLNAGANVITIVVLAQNGVTTKTYTVTINRAP